MATSEAQEIKKQETLVRFSIISYKTRLRVFRYQLDSKTVNQRENLYISNFPVLVRGHPWQPPIWVMLKKFVKSAPQETEVEIEEAMFNLCREIEIIQTQMPKLYKVEMANLIWNSGKLIGFLCFQKQSF